MVAEKGFFLFYLSEYNESVHTYITYDYTLGVYKQFNFVIIYKNIYFDVNGY